MKAYSKILMFGYLLSSLVDASILRVNEKKYLKVNSDATINYVDTEDKATNCFTIYHVYHLGLIGNSFLRVIFVPSTILKGNCLDRLLYLGYDNRQKFFLSACPNLSEDRIPLDILWKLVVCDTKCLVHNQCEHITLKVENPAFFGSLRR